jgi:SAM-dependent methyltransferase
MINGDNPDALVKAWDSAAEALESDPMRVIRYGKCFRYLTNLSRETTRVLEVGCGEGSGLTLLRQMGFQHLSGVEVSAERARRAAAKLPRDISVQVNSPTGALPFADATFDAVISAAVIEHTVDPVAFVADLTRVTKPGGVIVISSDCYSWRILQWLGIYQTAQPIDRAQPAWELRRQFERQGLTLLHSEGFPLPGAQFRFLRLLASKPLGFLRRQSARVARRLRFGHSAPPAARPFAPTKFSLSPWRTRPWLLSLPGLLLSDENVFFLRKTSG